MLLLVFKQQSMYNFPEQLFYTRIPMILYQVHIKEPFNFNH